MLTLYTFGPTETLPDPSPFVLKALVLLKMSGLAFETKTGGLRRAPNGKLPFLDDDGLTIADSTFIRMHLESRYGIDFDPGLTPAQRGAAWAFEKLCEDHLYWILVRERWLNDANFGAGSRMFFSAMPAPLRPLIIAAVRRRVRRNLWAQGLGRHDDAQIASLARRGFGAIADFLGEKPYLMGTEPCGADAVIFGWVVSALWDKTRGEVSDAVAGLQNLVRYRDRCMQRWFQPLQRP